MAFAGLKAAKAPRQFQIAGLGIPVPSQLNSAAYAKPPRLLSSAE